MFTDNTCLKIAANIRGLADSEETPDLEKVIRGCLSATERDQLERLLSECWHYSEKLYNETQNRQAK